MDSGITTDCDIDNRSVNQTGDCDKEEVDSVTKNRGSKKNDDSGSKDKNKEVIDECLSAPRSNGDGSDGKDAELMEDKMNNGIDEITKILSKSEDPTPILVVDDEFTKYYSIMIFLRLMLIVLIYASKLNANVNNDENKLFFVPTCTNNKRDEVVRFEEELVREGCEKWKYTVCGYFVGCRILETHLKIKILISPKRSSQEMLCIIEDVQGKIKLYVSFIYAFNSAIERRVLWSNLQLSKRIVNSDFNVTIKPDEKSTRASNMTSEMDEFRSVTQILEVDDTCSSGFFYTWTKSLKNPSNSILKKLDRIMCSDSFISSFGNAHGIFLPFMVSDHSPAVLVIPDGLPRKKKPFRFMNYVAD
ncbi:RNA-directed DNA polymerase, eukaryota, reverse transcriptase zinc-binding domain protein [Tanacetum coccineum]